MQVFYVEVQDPLLGTLGGEAVRRAALGMAPIEHELESFELLEASLRRHLIDLVGPAL